MAMFMAICVGKTHLRRIVEIVRIIDLEHAGKEGKFTLQCWPVELDNGIYTNEVDILLVQRILLCYLDLYSGDQAALDLWIS